MRTRSTAPVWAQRILSSDSIWIGIECKAIVPSTSCWSDGWLFRRFSSTTTSRSEQSPTIHFYDNVRTGNHSITPMSMSTLAQTLEVFDSAHATYSDVSCIYTQYLKNIVYNWHVKTYSVCWYIFRCLHVGCCLPLRRMIAAGRCEMLAGLCPGQFFVSPCRRLSKRSGCLQKVPWRLEKVTFLTCSLSLMFRKAVAIWIFLYNIDERKASYEYPQFHRVRDNQGEYVSLGWHERDDLAVCGLSIYIEFSNTYIFIFCCTVASVCEFLQQGRDWFSATITKLWCCPRKLSRKLVHVVRIAVLHWGQIGLWGRSMGAVTALMHSGRDSELGRSSLVKPHMNASVHWLDGLSMICLSPLCCRCTLFGLILCKS